MVSRCHSDTILRCYSVTILRCHNATVSWHHLGIFEYNRHLLSNQTIHNVPGFSLINWGHGKKISFSNKMATYHKLTVFKLNRVWVKKLQRREINASRRVYRFESCAQTQCKNRIDIFCSMSVFSIAWKRRKELILKFKIPEISTLSFRNFFIVCREIAWVSTNT